MADPRPSTHFAPCEPRPVEPSDRLNRVTRVGDYDILEELGRGGMGVVYKARHRELGRVVALKMILRSHVASVEDQFRFRQEGEAVARLAHPNIVQVYEVGTHVDLPYMVLEYVEGGTLAAYLEEHGSPAADWHGTAHLVEQLAAAVHLAHTHGIVHRDLKPANILLQNESTTKHTKHTKEEEDNSSPFRLFRVFRGSTLLPKITDFGLAKHMDRQGVTETGRILGTPGYMAPEQAQGKSSQIGPACDIYALGAILYELLTGRPPFQSNDGMDTVIQMLARDPLSPRRLRRGVPADLETICLKCLEKDPARRYATAQALADDLRRFQELQPIRARPVGVVERAGKWARRRPMVAALVASLVLVTVLGFAGVTLALVAAVAERRQAAEQRTVAQRERDKARAAQASEHEARHRAETNVAYGHLARALLEWRLNNLSASLTLLDQIDPGRRGWEWRYLQGLHHGDLHTLTRPDGLFVLGVGFRPDGKQVAATFSNPYQRRPDDTRPAEVAVWDAETGSLVRTLTGFRDLAFLVAYSPDGKRLAAGSDDGSLRVWDADTGQLLRLLRGHGLFRDLAWSADGNVIFAACIGSGLLGWDVQTGEPLPWLPTANGRLLAVSPDGRHLAAWADGVKLWDLKAGRQVWASDAETHRLAFSPCGQLLASASGELVRLYAVRDGRPVRTLGGHEGAVKGLAFSPCGQLLATGGSDSTVRVWDVEEGREVAVWRGHRGRVEYVAFHPGGARVVSCSSQPGEVKVWDLTRPQEFVRVAAASDRTIEAMAFTPSGDEVLLMRGGGVLSVRDAVSGMSRGSRQLPISNAWRTPGMLATFSPDAGHVAGVSAQDTRRVGVWEVATGRPLAGTYTHSLPVWQVVAGPDNLVATGALGRRSNGEVASEVAVWDAVTGRVVFRRDDPLAAGLSLAMSADGRRLARGLTLVTMGEAVGGKKPFRETTTVVEVWDVADASAAAVRLPLAETRVQGVAFSADGRLLAACTPGGKLYLWALPDGSPLFAEPISGPAGLEGLAFSPDGRLIAGVNRSLVTLWNVHDGQEVLRVRGVPPRPSDGGFSPRVRWSADGRKLAASNWDHSLTVWEAGEEVAAKRIGAVERLPRWHLRHAAAALRRGRPAAARFHLARLGELLVSDEEAAGVGR